MNEMTRAVFNVLVVDDDASIRATYRHILQPPPSELGGLEALINGAGAVAEANDMFVVVEADQGETAARLQDSALAEGKRFQLAFIDMRMPPGWDGMRTAIALRAQDPSIYIVIATAFSDYDVNALQQALGHDVVLLRKPFNQEEVYQLARTLCQSWETRQRLESITAEMESRVLARTAELDRRNALQSVLVEITMRFVEASGENDIDDAVNWSLARLGRAIDVDGCALYRFDRAGDCYSHRHEWNALGVKPLPSPMQRIARADLAPAHARFLRGESFQFSHLHELPPEMAGLGHLLTGHFESVLALPLEIGGHLLGFIAVGMVHATDKQDADLEPLLRMVGHAVTSALVAHEAGRKLAESQAMLARSENLAHIGSWEWDVATDTVKWSDQMFQIFQLPPGRGAPSLAEQARLYLPEDMARLRQLVDAAVSQGAPYEVELRALRGDGSTRICLARGYPERGGDNRVARLYGSLQDITELQSVKQALQASEARYRNIVETAEEGIWQVDQSWRTVYVNRRMEALLGYPPGAMLGRGIEDFMPPAEVEQAAALKLHREQGLREVNEFRLQRADGGALHTLMSTTPLFDADGSFAGATAMVTDISQRMQVEAALAATAEFVSRPGGEAYDADMVRHAAQTLGLDYVHIARLHPDGRGVTTEAAWLDGRLIDNWSYELADTPCVEVLYKSRRCITSGVQAAYPADSDLHNVGAEGYVGEPVVDSSGQVLGLIVGISRAPIRSSAMIQSNLRILAARAGAEWEQHAAWSKLREERDFNRNILRNTEAIVVTLDTQGRITLINRKGCQLLGYDEAELLGQDWFSTCLPPNEHIDQIREIFSKALLDDLAGSEYYENPVQTRAGEQRLIAWHNNSMRDVDGNLLGGMSIGMDVTRQRQAEALLHASEERFHRLFDDADAMAIQGYLPDGEVVFWNHASEKIYGYSAAEAVGRNLYDLIIPPAMRDEVRAGVRQIIESGRRIPPGRLWLRHKDGHSVLVYSSHTLVETPGQPKMLFCMDVDLNELAQVEAELNIALTKYKTLFDSFPLGITITDPAGRVLETNSAAEELLGVPRSVHMQRDIDSPAWRIVRVDGTPMPPEEYASVRALKEKRRIENVEMGIVKAEGEITWISVTADLLPLDGYGLVISYGDISARRAAEEQIRLMAYYDPLTNLPNRRLLMDRLAQALIASKRSQAYGALLMLDLDNFKRLNDSYGHSVGDQLLIEVADRLRAHVRQEDSVARLGGDEYVVILEELGGDFDAAMQQADRLAEKIRLALARPYLLAGVEKPYSCSASIGVRLFRSHLESVENVLKQADAALYQAKDAGRDKVLFYASH